jgi:hypothetical protein
VRGELADAVIWQDVAQRAITGALMGAAVAGVLILLWLAALLAGDENHTNPHARKHFDKLSANDALNANELNRGAIGFKFTKLFLAQAPLPWVTGFITLAILCITAGTLWHISLGWHVLGTDRAGNDMLYLSLKSVRTAQLA